jgi:hypothetical protein
MIPSFLRSAIFILEALYFLTPLFSRARKQKLPGLLKELIILGLTNWTLIWKWMEKQRWSIETREKFFQFLKDRQSQRDTKP